MPGTTRKRPLPLSIAKMHDRKRQRIANPVVDGQLPASLAATRLDDLTWRSVSAPALDDYEGFYGMEEIDDVQVLHDEARGTVTFRQAPNQTEAERKTRTNVDESGQMLGRLTGKEVAKDDAWEGFSDGSTAHVQTDSRLGKSDSSAQKRKKVLITNGTKPMPVTSAKRDDSGSNQFYALDGGADADADIDVSAWKSLSLAQATTSSISSMGFHKPTAIQSATIPAIVAGEDLIGKAPTGSGKTLAFGIPIFEQWLLKQAQRKPAHPNSSQHSPTALVISPTRELAHQITSHLTALRQNRDSREMSVVTVTGGLSIQKQRRLLEGADVVVATPGRLWEVMSEAQDTLERIRKTKILVIDEADRLLGQGHFKDLEQVLTALDRADQDEGHENKPSLRNRSQQRQTLMFSATFDKDLQQKLSKQAKFVNDVTKQGSMAYLLKKLKFRKQPKFVDVNPRAQMASNLQEKMLEVPVGTEKDLYLYALLLLHRPHPQTRSLVFVNSIAAVRRLVPYLQNVGLSALPLHSQMEQKARLRSVERYTRTDHANKSRNGKHSATSILVATDVAARGLDIPEVHLVVHYHIPRTADGYVHRSGRTARAAASGTSILMCAPTEASGVRRLVAKVHAKKTKKHQDLQMIDLEGKIISRLKPRATLAKTIADVEQAKEKGGAAKSWMADAADDLGVDLEEEFGEDATASGGSKGRGKKRKEREAEGRAMSQAELKGAKAQLKEMLSEKVNIGVSERYLTSGNVDINALLQERERTAGELGGGFVGRVDHISL